MTLITIVFVMYIIFVIIIAGSQYIVAKTKF